MNDSYSLDFFSFLVTAFDTMRVSLLLAVGCKYRNTLCIAILSCNKNW